MKLFNLRRKSVKNVANNPAENHVLQEYEQQYFSKEEIFQKEIEPVVSELYARCKKYEIPVMCLTAVKADDLGVMYHHCFHFSQFAPRSFYEFAIYLNKLGNESLFKKDGAKE